MEVNLVGKFSVRTNQHRVSAWGGKVNHQGKVKKLNKENIFSITGKSECHSKMSAQPDSLN